jgi:hypothetical protein
MRDLCAATLAAAVLAPCAALSQPAEGDPAPMPAPVEEKKPGLVETLGGAVGGALGSTAGAAGGPLGSAAAGLVGQHVGKGAGGFVRRIFKGKPKPTPETPAPPMPEQLAESEPQPPLEPPQQVAETGEALPAADVALAPVEAPRPAPQPASEPASDTLIPDDPAPVAVSP